MISLATMKLMWCVGHWVMLKVLALCHEHVWEQDLVISSFNSSSHFESTYLVGIIASTKGTSCFISNHLVSLALRWDYKFKFRGYF